MSITISGTSDSRLLWTFASPWDISLPDEALESSIGKTPEDFARAVLAGVPQHEGKPDLGLFLKGLGSRIRDVVPARFWSVLDSVQTAVGTERRLTLLLLSEEPHVPWELALVDSPQFSNAPPFLAAQTALGRWILQPHSDQISPSYVAKQRPFAVVVGHYKGKNALPGAIAEATELASRYDAVTIQARLRQLVQCLGGQPPSRVLHFALHGVYAPGTGSDGLYLEDDNFLEPLVIRGASLIHVPLVFLNACELGTGSQSLGAYAGTAEAFISAGATAVIAPLWAIDDDEARSIAIGFYKSVFVGAAVGDVLADVRGGFNEHAAVATRLAYQFFGHPLLQFDPI